MIVLNVFDIHPFQANIPILEHLKTTGNHWLFGVFREHKMKTLARNMLNRLIF